MTSASAVGRRWWGPWAVVLLGTTACGASAPSSSPVTVWSSTPSTVVPAAPTTEPPPPSTASVAATVPTAPLSPLAALVSDIGTAVYDPAEDTQAPTPVAISISDLRVLDAPVTPVGVLEQGDLDVPDPKVVGWYRHGPAPDDPGSTVLAAHVNFNGVPGVFRYLRDLDPGATVDVRLSDGSVRSYVVNEVRMVDKDDLDEIGVWRRDGDPSLTLVTCGGRFDDDRRRYEDNVIAFATPV